MKHASPSLAALLTLAALCGPASATAVGPEPTDSEKLDTLLGMQRQLVRTLKNDPLADKSFGVEFNIPRLLLTQDETFSMSGGVSLFNVDRKAEIAFPFLYMRSRTDVDGYDFANDQFTEFTQDVHYRRFLGNTQNGFYLSGFARGAYVDGILGETLFDNLGDSTATTDHRASEGKLGVGVGLGYRKFSYWGLYWGASLNVGRYLIGESDKFRGGLFSVDADNETIIDVEFFKFGWAF